MVSDGRNVTCYCKSFSYSSIGRLCLARAYLLLYAFSVLEHELLSSIEESSSRFIMPVEFVCM